MKLEIEFMGPIRRPWPEQMREIEVPDGTKVKGLLSALGFSETEASSINVLRDGLRLRAFNLLIDGERLVLMVPAGVG